MSTENPNNKSGRRNKPGGEGGGGGGGGGEEDFNIKTNFFFNLIKAILMQNYYEIISTPT